MGLYAKALSSLKEAWNLVKPDPLASWDQQKKYTQARERITRLRERIVEARRLGGELQAKREMEAEDKLQAEQLAKEKAELAKKKATINFTHLLSGDNLIMIARHGLMDDPMFGLRMAHVCREWRDVMTNQPSLWSSLVLGAKRPVRHASTWIKHSKGRITELHFVDDFDINKIDVIQDKLEDSIGELKALTIQTIPTFNESLR